MREYLLKVPEQGEGNLCAGPRREELQVGGASCPGSRWGRRRGWAQLKPRGKSRGEVGGRAVGGGEAHTLGAPTWCRSSSSLPRAL